VGLWLKPVNLGQMLVDTWQAGTMLYLLCEPSELSQWLCHDGSNINIVVGISIIIFYFTSMCE